MLSIDRTTARRFVLGKQGLWPGRRWQGLKNVPLAMQEMEYLQLDPLQMMARSHDIQLYSRVLDYQAGFWEKVTYEERAFFDWGDWLAARPMEELPHWRNVMQRQRNYSPQMLKIATEHAGTINEMREILQQNPTVSNRDFKTKSRTRINSYRGRKDSSLALYYLWLTGEVMTHHREKFERVYALSEAVAPKQWLDQSDDLTTNRFLIQKEIGFMGLTRLKRTPHGYFSSIPAKQMKQIFDDLLAKGEIIELKIEGWKQVHYALGRDVAILQDLSAGRIPQTWQPLAQDTTQEAVFLAPLDPVSARGRAKILFDFEYVWEVYKPAEKRQYGYYTLPVLWGDNLVARFDGKFDRSTNTLIVLGLWLEDQNLATNEAFSEALALGFLRYARFLGANKLDVKAIDEPLLQKRCIAEPLDQ